MAIPEGYEIVDRIPEGYEAVSDEMTGKDIATGAADIVGAGLYGIGEKIASGVPGAIATIATGQGAKYGAPTVEAIEQAIPDYELGEDAQRIVSGVSDLYKKYAPETVKKVLTAIAESPETVMTAGEEAVSGGAPAIVGDLAATLATGLKVAPEVLGTMGAARTIPEAVGRTAAATQRLVSPEKRQIARQLERQQELPEPDFEADTGKEMVTSSDQNLWESDAIKPEEDLGLAGYTTSTAPYTLSPTGRVITNPKFKVAKEAGFSNALLGVVERANPETKAKYKQMVDMRERLYELPEQSSKYDPTIVTGRSLQNRLNVIRDINKESGKAIDRYVNKNLGIEVNPRPLMDDVSGKWREKGVSLDPASGKLEFGELELSDAGMRTVQDIFDRMKRDVKGKVTGKTVHNLKRIIDEKIAYGKDVDGLDAKTQELLKDFRGSIKEYLESQFPEYARANADYSSTIDVIDRIQKAAGKVDLEGSFATANLGRMSRAIMSQRVSRDEILTAINDLDKLSSKHGEVFKDDLVGQVHFANQMDEIWGPSRATSFAGQTKQGVASGISDITGEGIQGGVAVTKKAMEALRKKGIDEKQKFQAMRELLK